MPHTKWKYVTGLNRAEIPPSRQGVPWRVEGTATRRQFLIGALSMATVGTLSANANAAPLIVTNLREFREALARLSPHYQAALVDIGAEWCAVCKTIDRKILPDPGVQRAMQRIALIKVDVTRMDQTSRELLRHLRADGPTTLFVIQTESGREYSGTRSVGSVTARDLIRRLRPFA